MPAWKGISGSIRNSTFHSMEAGIQNPGSGNPKRNLQCLDDQPGTEISKAQLICQLFIYTPVKKTDDAHKNEFLSEIGDNLHNFVHGRGADPFQQPEKIHR